VKISNETKVGVFAIVVIALLILGFNFLKGSTFFSNKMTIYAKYPNIQGLTPSNPIMINGLQVGSVTNITNDKNMREMLVSFSLNREINIPANSIALIIPNPLTNTKIEIKLGDANTYLKNNDTIFTEANKGLLDDVMKIVDPVLFEVKNAVSTLDTLLGNVNNVLDKQTRNNIGSMIAHLNELSASLLISSNSIQQLLSKETGSISKSLDNLNSFTGNLSSKNSQINSVLNNLDQTTGKLAALDLQKTLTTLDTTITELKTIVTKLNNKESTLGLMLTDPTLYNNISSTGNKINVLLDDIRVHPKRYVNISIFGRKQNDPPLMQPLPDTVNAPYLIKKQN